MKNYVIALTGSLVLFALSCSKKNGDTVITPPPGGATGGCDTANMKYTANVTPILSAHCYSCHGASSNTGSGGIVLEGYANLKAKVDNGQLIGVITHAAGFNPMPRNAPKLSDCDINTIRSWINNATLNN